MGALTDNGGGSFTATIDATADGVVTVDVPADVAQDTAGNDNTAATQYVVTVDTQAPVPVISGPASPTNSDPFDVTIDFGEAVTGFVAGDITVGNGTVMGVLTDNGGGSFTATIDATADGVVTVDVPSDVAQDTAGNDNTAATQYVVTVDTQAPVPVISGPASPTNSDLFEVTIDFGEPVTGFVAGEITVGNGTVMGMLTDNGGGSFTATIDATAEGLVTIDIPVAVAQDTAGNGNPSAHFEIIYQECSFTVINTSDSGLGALRTAIQCANDTPGMQTIDFAIPGGGVHTIQPATALPNIMDPVVVDGTTQPGFAGTPLIEISGVSTGTDVSGLTVSGGGGGSTIRGLAINRFDAHGILVSRKDNVTIEGNYLGTDANGTVDLGNGQAGVRIINGANNTVRDNLISGNEMGVIVEGPLSTGNVLVGNTLGTDAAGTVSLKNRLVNVDIAGASGNTVGGPGNGDRNLISGSKVGIHIRGSAATGNFVQGNLIGTNAGGAAAIFNNRGIEIKNEASGNTIGGAGDAGNVISGNTKGVLLNAVGNNLIHGNKIGTNEAGDAALPNTRGVLISGGANNLIGDEPNVISGNLREGVRIFKPGASGNVIRDNFIGTNAAGDAAIGNRNGVTVSRDAGGSNTIGGTTGAERNIISGNIRAGVVLQADGNSVTGNFIGADATGTAALGNETGVLILGSAGNTIGGAVGSGAGNVISGNAEEGVRITRDGATGNTITGNAIGTDQGGMNAVGNAHGVRIESGGNTVGGATAADGNVISGNTQNGVYLVDAAATGNMIQSNRIGINIDGSGAVANERSGVLIEGAADNTIGGPDKGNAIGGNTQQGIRIAGAGSTGNLVQDNSIGFDGVTMTVVPNRDGVRITDEASGNTVGGAGNLGNEIAHNAGRGVLITGGMGNTVTQNSIHDNGGLGIDLSGSGNNLQNAPLINTAVSSGGNTTVTGTLNSAPNSTFTVDFFSSPTADPSGNGEGETFLGSTVVTTDGGGDANFAPSFSVDVPSGHVVTATATDAGGNTSEFSNAVTMASMLQAAAGPAAARQAGGSPTGLSASELQPIVNAAIDQLVAAGFTADSFDNVNFAIADLPGATLGLTMGNTITIDVNAAGYGWFIDATPVDDSEFSNPKSAFRNPQSMDLLSVVMHELGHVAGLHDLDDAAAEEDLMYAWLEAGTRRDASEANVDTALAELFGE